MNYLKLKDLRGDRTLRSVSIETGLSEMTIRNAENNPNNMNMTTALALSNFYGVQIDRIVDRTGATKI